MLGLGNRRPVRYAKRDIVDIQSVTLCWVMDLVYRFSRTTTLIVPKS
jgi:hypothetical protein